MIDKESLEGAILKQKRAIQKVKMISRYFTFYAEKHLLPWLHKIAEQFKMVGEIPLLPLMIGDYYQDPHDRELALFSTLLMSADNNVYEQVQDMRSIIGEHPAQWLKDRMFTYLSVGREQDNTLVGYSKCTYLKISQLYDKIYNLTKGGTRFYTLCEKYKALGHERFCYLLDINDNDERFRFLMMALCTSGGIGRQVWDCEPPTLRCPLVKEVCRFLRVWFPDYKRLKDTDKAVSLFGFKRDCDLFYAALGWQQMARINPKGCNRMATIYNNWYTNGYRRHPNQWRVIIPPIKM